ncbi:hypothetical protein F966_01401 [Acinetobacter higginsii]|uniref:Uncharacterized protein n=1 Tax=Acinetobacter higginsii TaxID=70347 RepID=N8XS24_9GAMM|nr:hypothetical protein [Acinetobacter higginsii]ENV10228.1 hypothetical protein F966_01401 [Acinetobacter higginsii]
MSNSYYVYNNEALSCCIILEVLKIVRSMNYDRLCLVLPFLLDNNTVKKISLESFESDSFLIRVSNQYFNFNKRFINLLPVMVNSIVILEKLKKVNLYDMNVSCNDFSSLNEVLGERFLNIKKVIPLFINEFDKYTTKELYESLGVEL